MTCQPPRSPAKPGTRHLNARHRRSFRTRADACAPVLVRRNQADLRLTAPCLAAKVPSPTLCWRGLLVQARGELLALAVGEAAERLAGRDAAVVQHLRGLDPPDLGDREQHVEYLGARKPCGWVEQ